MKNIAINIVTKLVVVFMGLFVSSSVLAQNGNVREETARQVGLNFLKLKDGKPRSDLQLTRVDVVQYPNLYVYNTSENGFIVVASDNRMEPILAYSDEGTFDKDNVAPGANFWFEMYDYTIDSIVRNNVRDVDEKITRKWEDLIDGVRTEPTRSIYPPYHEKLIFTKWNQGVIDGDKYNRFCPYYQDEIGNKFYSVTGCVTTSLAQVLYYFSCFSSDHIPINQEIKYPFRHKRYKIQGHYYDIPLRFDKPDGTFYESQLKIGCQMPERIIVNIGGWSSYSGDDKISKMMLDCGLVIDNVYGMDVLDGTGAKALKSEACPTERSLEYALKQYFSFPDAFGRYRDQNYLFWIETLKKYINHGKPVFYGGTKYNGDKHLFICDGYDGDLFHFNFGWGDGPNGHFYVGSPAGYSYRQVAVFVEKIPDNEVIDNDIIRMGVTINNKWCYPTHTLQVKYIEEGVPNPNQLEYNNESGKKIVKEYNSPGLYTIEDNCGEDHLIWNVRVVDMDTLIAIPETICRKSNYERGIDCYDDNQNKIGVAHFSLSRDSTDFSGSKKFTECIKDDNGSIVGICSLELTTSGQVRIIPKTYVVDICDLTEQEGAYQNMNRGVYIWDVKGDYGDHSVKILCDRSGYYEYEDDTEGECGTVYTMNLIINKPDYYYREEDKTSNNPYRWDRTGLNYPLKSGYGDYVFYHCKNGQLYVLNLTYFPGDCKAPLGCLKDKVNPGQRNMPSNMETIYYGLNHYYNYRDAMNIYLVQVLGGLVWPSIEERNIFWNLFQSLLDTNTGMMSEEAMLHLIVTNPYDYITDEYVTDLVERYNRSVMYWNEGVYTIWDLPEGYNSDFIEYDTTVMNKAYEAYDYAIAHGFSDVKAMYDNAYELLAAEVENIQTSVCAHVTLQFNQKMTMTREAFNGTLQIFNGHDSIPMQDIMVDFRIEDQQGNDCTNLFQINTLSLDQISGISGDGSLAAQTNGTTMVQFIPTKNAAPIQPVVYSFGGSFSFIDPFTGEGLTYPLHPVDITVNPSPDLYVDIMMQRDILGDDALTLGVVEPSVPAELGVIIHNQGAGTAKNVILETAEPQIIDNEKGLAVSFGLYDASFNGSPRQLGLHDISFGNIESGLTAVGEWRFTSSLLGHFISYQANLIHNSSYGNPDLSLVSHLDIHELIHPIYAYGNLDDGINDFLVNDNPDAYDTPDSIYFSHGGKTSVGVVNGISFDHYVSPSDTIVTLTVVPSRIGWNYGVTDDPGMNQYDIVSCIRNNDNQVIPLNNVWLTFVTIPDGGDPVYENKLHIVDTIPVQQTTTYTLVFSKKPSNLRIFNGNVDVYWSNAENWEGSIMPQADDEVLINGICLLDEDVEVFSLTVAENQSLTIPADKLLNVSGMLTSEATSRMIIEDGGQLKHRNEGVQATVKKNIEPYTNNDNGWYLIASPLSGFTTVASVTNMLSNEYDLYYYDEPTAYWITEEYAANGFTELVNGKGYLYANSEGVVLEFPGTLRSGNTTVTVPLFYTEGTELKGFNLVGNPFVYNLTTYASHNVAEGCFRMNEAKDDLIVSEISEANPLKPAEGFFVKAFGEGATLTFNPQMNSAAPEGSIYVELSENNLLIDRLIVKTREGSPLEKFSLSETRSKVFAQGRQRECAIVPCESHEQPVSFKAAKNGTYTINVNADGMEFYYLHLIDNLTGNDVNLLAESSYTFDARTTDYASRFLLRFIPKDGSSTGSGIEHFAYCFNDKWIITNEGDATLQVMDVLGHVLSSERINGTCEKQIGASAGVYVLRLINRDETRVQKIVVK